LANGITRSHFNVSSRLERFHKAAKSSALASDVIQFLRRERYNPIAYEAELNHHHGFAADYKCNRTAQEEWLNGFEKRNRITTLTSRGALRLLGA